MRDLPGDNLALIRGLWCTIMSCKRGNFIEFYRLSGIYFPNITAADDVSLAAYFLMAGGICQCGCSPFCFSVELLAQRGINYDQNVNFHSIYTAWFFFFSKTDDQAGTYTIHKHSKVESQAFSSCFLGCFFLIKTQHKSSAA